MLRACRNQIDARRRKAAVAEHVRELRDVVRCVVKRAGEQMPQVMREDFSRRDAGRKAQRLHLLPNPFARHWTSASGAKHRTGGDFFARGVRHQFAAELSGQQNRADFPLQGDFGLAAAQGFHRDRPHFADADAGAADCFEQ